MSRSARIALVAAGMIAVIIAMAALYARDLHGGTEITLKTEPVDPRSLFLGHYATLGYAINRLEGDILAGRCYRRHDAIFVTLEETDGEWRAVRAAPSMPDDGFAQGRVTLRGRVAWGVCPEPVARSFRTVDYGVEQYFASPGAAKRLEDLARRLPVEGEEALAPLEIVLSVPRSGRALIKGVVIDGEKVYDQTIW